MTASGDDAVSPLSRAHQMGVGVFWKEGYVYISYM